ncbi:hypothetical protein ACIQAL_05285 [Pseudomonas sp. NPDC088368]|jgi:alkylhydroperoxidase/carboxymuconolactone decarboxylase family protein YurZ|uniref:hypothetical protein n=1 Tax=Pseudomonas sp. NPDC088368 TaxID=3364453 RepID=UPI00381BBE46
MQQRTLGNSGQTAQLTLYLNRAIDNGLTREQAAEVVTRLVFLRRLAKSDVSRAGAQGGLRVARLTRQH